MKRKKPKSLIERKMADPAYRERMGRGYPAFIREAEAEIKKESAAGVVKEPHPGPWEWEPHGDGYALYSDRGEFKHGANILTVGKDGFCWNGEANRRLIKAAPDLLAAAKLFVEVHAIHCKGPKCREFGIDLFKAAIAKAEGR